LDVSGPSGSARPVSSRWACPRSSTARVGGIVDHLHPRDKNADHCRAEFCALLIIPADLSVEAFEVSVAARFHGAAIQQSRQFLVGHPDLWHGVSR